MYEVGDGDSEGKALTYKGRDLILSLYLLSLPGGLAWMDNH
jgi:hypothetical protein